MNRLPGSPPYRGVVALTALLGTIPTVALAAGRRSAGVDVLAASPVADTVEETGRHLTRMQGGATVFPLPESPARPLLVLDPRLADRIADMERRSPKWRKALQGIREKEIPVLVGTIVQVEQWLPVLRQHAFDGAAATWIFSDEDGRPFGAAVAVNLPMLIVRSRVLEGDGVQLRRMLDVHLAHEIYGHLTPVVTSEDPDHPCRLDPDRSAPPGEQRRSCVMRRENQLMVELGYEPRDTYLWDYWDEWILRSDSADAGLPKVP